MDLLDDLVLVGWSHENIEIGKRREHDDYTLDSRKCVCRDTTRPIEYHLGQCYASVWNAYFGGVMVGVRIEK